jgi:hypothetical protein
MPDGETGPDAAAPDAEASGVSEGADTVGRSPPTRPRAGIAQSQIPNPLTVLREKGEKPRPALAHCNMNMRM